MEHENKLKPCPFCGGTAKLVRIRSSYKTNPVTIMDEWEVQCEKKCCSTLSFQDVIYHANNGDVVVEKNGAIAAIEFWNGIE